MSNRTTTNSPQHSLNDLLMTDFSNAGHLMAPAFKMTIDALNGFGNVLNQAISDERFYRKLTGKNHHRRFTTGHGHFNLPITDIRKN